MAIEDDGAVAPDLRDCRILVVEDDPLVAWDIETILQDAGGTVVGPVGKLAQALELIATAKFDLGLLDLNLGKDDSLQAADRLDEVGIPFVFLSGHSIDFLPERHRNRPLVAKPFDPRLLMSALSDAMNPASGNADG